MKRQFPTKRQVLFTFAYIIFCLVFGANASHDYPYVSIILWTLAGVVLIGSVLDWVYQWRGKMIKRKKRTGGLSPLATIILAIVIVVAVLLLGVLVYPLTMPGAHVIPMHS